MEKSIVSLFRQRAREYGEATALLWRNKNNHDSFEPISFKDLYTIASLFGAGLLAIGVKRNDHIGVVSDNRKEWMIANLGILGIGAADVPRGSDSMKDEIGYILNHGDCTLALVEDKDQLDKVLSAKDQIPSLRRVIVMDPEYVDDHKNPGGMTLHTFEQILEMGKARLGEHPDSFDSEVDRTTGEDLATIIYTSGTTGEPKGVMLTHANFLHQIRAPLAHLDVRKGDVFLSVLPVWHAFERSVEYVALFAGCSLVYSKLIGKVMLADMEASRPTIFPSVPRIWELIRSGVYKKIKEESAFRFALFRFFVAAGGKYAHFLTMWRGLLPQFKKRNRILDLIAGTFPLVLLTPLKLLGDLLVFGKIKKKLGGRFKFGISGAGALPPHVDKFFAACGIMLLEGYGLTEAAPICSVRKDFAPVPDTIGPILPEMEARVVDNDGKVVGPGIKGVLHVKGPNVMTGYYKRPDETRKVISSDGWLNTGDLAMLTHRGEIKIIGRVKETIVLLGGENIEPGPIEDTILQSSYINQVIIVGQDRKYLGALVVPNMDAIEEFAKAHGVLYQKPADLIEHPAIYELVKREINARINAGKGFKFFEKIVKIKLLPNEFKIGEEITHTLKLRRDVILHNYTDVIAKLFS